VTFSIYQVRLLFEAYIIILDPEVPTLIHWAARHGLPKTVQALMALPEAAEASTRQNSHLLTAAEIAHRHGHLEVAHLLR
jgi:ankyrin repeat protein